MTAVVQRRELLNLQSLRVLQDLVNWLQQPVWPEKAKISREEAFTLIVNLAPSLGVEIDVTNIDQLKQDPNFLTRVALKISQLLLKGQTASIPPNLKELVAEYEKHLAEIVPSSEVKESVLKILYPQPNKPTLNAHQELESQIETNLKETFPQLASTPEVAKAVSEKVTNLIVTTLPQVARPEVFLPAEIEQVLKTIQPEVNRALKQAGVAEPEITPKKLTEVAKQTLPAVRKLAATPHLIQPPLSLKTKETTLKILYPRLDETTRKTHQQLVDQIKTEIVTLHPELTQLPAVTDNLSNQLANTFVATLPQAARREAFKPEAFQGNLETIRPVIERIFRQVSVEPKISKEKLAEISQKTLPAIQNLVVTPHTSFSPLLPTTKEAALKASFIHYDESTRALYPQIEEKVFQSLQTIEALNASPLAQQIVSERVSFALLSQTPSTTEAISPEQRQTLISQAIDQELKRIGYELPPQETIPQIAADIAEQTEPEITKLTTVPRTFMALPDFLETEKVSELSVKAKRITQTENILAQKISFELRTAKPTLAADPELAQTLSQEVKDVVAVHLFALPQKTITPEEYKELLATALPEIRERLATEGISFQPKQAEFLIKNIASASQTEAAILTNLGAPVLPKAVVDQLAKTTDGVAFKPIYTILNPKLTFAYLKKIALTPAKLILDASASQATPEWQEMIREGLFAKDIQASLAALKKAGLPEAHPAVAILKEKMLTMADQDTLAAKILRHYWEYNKLTGRKQIWESDAKFFLPRLSPSSLWSKLTGFPWQLRQTFNELGLKLKIFQKIEIAPGKNVIRFVLPDKIIRFFTFGRFQTFAALKGVVKLKIRQGITALAKTGLGKAITKGATWIAIKLGLKAAVTAAAAGVAAVTGPPGWLVAAAVEVISFIGKKILRPIFDKLKQIIKEPEKALGLIGVGAVAMVILPMPFALIGAIPITLGGLGLISAGIGSAGAIASGFATGVATFFTTLTTVPITAAAGLLIVGTITALSVATFFIVITTAGAFILPTAPEITEPITIGESVEPRPPSEAGHLAESVIFTLNQCGVTLVNTNTWETTRTCLQASNLQNKQTIIDQFHYSVFDVGPGLQCVGFVRGIMAALSKDPGGGYHARDYLLNPPSNYTKNTNMSEVQVGDLVVMLGGSYGHIGIVVLKDEDIIRVAQAWGITQRGSGFLQITELNPAYFDGFLRPK